MVCYGITFINLHTIKRNKRRPKNILDVKHFHYFGPKQNMFVFTVLLGSGVKRWESSLEPPGIDSSSISSEAESIDDVWTITDEQREYYVKQFISMQQDLSGVITGLLSDFFIL